MIVRRLKIALSLGITASAVALMGCTQGVDSLATASLGAKIHTSKDRECLERAMYFESVRSSYEGLLAVGTVVMNRVDSDAYPDGICEVVGQRNQFAPGVLSRPMRSKESTHVQKAAEAVLRGERHPGVREAKFFHAAGLKFPYGNMHYVLVAGGNAFYEKR